MGQLITLPINEQMIQQKLKIASACVQFGINTASELVEYFPNMSESEALDLFNDDEFLEIITKHTDAQLNMAWHTVAVPNLTQLLNSDDDKLKLNAINTLAKIRGKVGNEKGNTEKVLEELIERLTVKEKKVNANIFDLETSIEELLTDKESESEDEEDL